MIAVVTGASRGVGKGIAIALGAAGMTVYVTGRTATTVDASLPGTVFETASAVTQAGGTGVPVILDHADDQAVAALFERIRQDHGQLDILVNNAVDMPSPVAGGFWEKPLALYGNLFNVGLRSHFTASYFAAPLLIANGRGLIVTTSQYGAVSYFRSPVYGAQKAGSDKMIADMAKELRPLNVAAIALWLGGVETERAMAWINSQPPEKRPAGKRESAQFAGRVIAALFNSEHLMQLSGQALIGAELGALLGVTDIDGTLPPSHRYTMGGPPQLHPSLLA